MPAEENKKIIFCVSCSSIKHIIIVASCEHRFVLMLLNYFMNMNIFDYSQAYNIYKYFFLQLREGYN